MSRRRTRNRAAQAAPEVSPYTAMKKGELDAIFREKGGLGVPEGWPIETVIRKIEELEK